MALLETLKETLRAPDPLLQAGDSVLVAVSGGTDSLALLHALATLRDEIGLKALSAAHFHHGLRGTEADADAAFVQEFCVTHALPCTLGTAEIAAVAARTHHSIQETARRARYEFLERAADAAGANKIATAHTQDDQIETVLLHILRGTGIDGLRGIPRRRGRVVRPLHNVTRVQTEAYCAAHGLTPRQDSSNADTSHYTRNRVRLELLPLLERNYHPGVRESLRRLSQIADAEADFLQMQAEAALLHVAQRRTAEPTGLVLSRAGLLEMHPGLRLAVLRTALGQVRGTGNGITFRHLDLVDAAILSNYPAAWTLTTPSPICHIRVTADKVIFIRDTPRQEKSSPYSVSLSTDGMIVMTELGWRMQVQSGAWDGRLPQNRYAAVLDADTVHRPSLRVRTWQPGDRIAPLGMPGHTKKVQNLFMDAKVPRAERHRIPILADQGGLLWVTGLTVTERARVTEKTERCLRFHAEPLVSFEETG